MLLINTILLSLLLFNREVNDCQDTNGYSSVGNSSEVSIEEYEIEHEVLHAEYREGSAFMNANTIPGKYAFLTFDDGPSPYTQGILNVLDEKNAPGIFFVIGNNIERRSDSAQLLNQILDDGHYIGLHTMTHDYTTLYVGEGAPARFVDEMLELNELVATIITEDFSTSLCRAAYGMSTTFTPEHHIAVEEAGLYCVDWNIDSRDWQQRTAYLVYQNVTSQIETQGFPDELVILFHEFSWTIEALPGIIDYLRYHGYTIIAYTPGHKFN